MHLYTQEWYEKLQVGARRSARTIVPLVLQLVQPKRVIDVGCGVGTWLSVFQEWGVQEITGIDGGHVQKEMLEIPAQRFLTRDLQHPFRLPERFDLVLSLEVAEHLPPASADAFIESLTALGPVVLFSAAIPLQGGEHHVNEQWPDYWAERFQKQGFAAIDCLRKQVWHKETVEWWYAQNLLLFASQEYLRSHPALRQEAERTTISQLPIVHPRRFLASHRPQLITHDTAPPSATPALVTEPESCGTGAAIGPRSPAAAANQRVAMARTELRRYLGNGFRTDWLSDCAHRQSGLLLNSSLEAAVPEAEEKCPACLYALSALEPAAGVESSCALLRRLLPAPASVLEAGCGIGTTGLRLLEDGYQVAFANSSGQTSRYLRWRLSQRGLDASVFDPRCDALPPLDAVIRSDVLPDTPESLALLERLEPLGDLLIVHLAAAPPNPVRVGASPDGDPLSALLAGIRSRFPVLAVQPAGPPECPVVTVAYFTGTQRPLASSDLCRVDLSSPAPVGKQIQDSLAEVVWLLDADAANEAAARWHRAFHRRHPERYAVAAGPTWPCGGALNLSVKRSFLLDLLRHLDLDDAQVDAATIEAALQIAGACREILPAACAARASAPAVEMPRDRRAQAVWLTSSVGRAAAGAADFSTLGAGAASDLAVSVIMVSQGDDPRPVLQALAAMQEEWRDDWELVLVSRSGSACEKATLFLEGDFRLIRNVEPVSDELALKQGALAARGGWLHLMTAVGPLRLPREQFLAANDHPDLDAPARVTPSRWPAEACLESRLIRSQPPEEEYAYPVSL